MNKHFNPKISIIIPVYNGSNYMREAIDSALAQSYENKEILVVNDGSNDSGATEKIALEYGDRIKYIKKENGGVSTALNAGIKAMSGEYFSWLSHDDKYLPTKLESQIEILKRFQGEKIIALCSSKQIDCYSNDLEKGKSSNKGINVTRAGEIIPWNYALHFVIQNCFGGCSLLIPKKAFEECGLFDESLRYCQDFVMWMKFFINGWSIVKTPGVQVCYRVHDKQQTASSTGMQIYHKECIAIGDELLDDLIQKTKSNTEFNFVRDFALYNAKYNNPQVVKKYIEAGKKNNLLTSGEIAKINLVLKYGAIRPIIRKVYYKLRQK